MTMLFLLTCDSCGQPGVPFGGDPVCGVCGAEQEEPFRVGWGAQPTTWRGTAMSEPSRFAQCDATCTVDCGHCKGEYCWQSKRVDGPLHSWRFDGDDPYIECLFCGEYRDARTGRVVKPAAQLVPDTQPAEHGAVKPSGTGASGPADRRIVP